MIAALPRSLTDFASATIAKTSFGDAAFNARCRGKIIPAVQDDN